MRKTTLQISKAKIKRGRKKELHHCVTSEQQHLRSAHGYIELGMFDEANAELMEIDPFCRHLPEVLLTRVVIYHGLKKWEVMATVAGRLVVRTLKKQAISSTWPMQNGVPKASMSPTSF